MDNRKYITEHGVYKLNPHYQQPIVVEDTSKKRKDRETSTGTGPGFFDYHVATAMKNHASDQNTDPKRRK